MTREEAVQILLRSGLCNGGRDVQGVKVAGIQEPIHGREIDMVRIHVIGHLPG